MILRRLSVEHFRKHNLPVELTFDERLTIVSGQNEAGKTTLFEALQYALFRRSSAKGKDIEALAPWDTSGLPATVTVDFAHGGIEYQLRKTWGKQAGTQLAKRNASGIFVPDMADGADDFLAGIFAGQPPRQGLFSGFTGQHMGLAYLLFVPQGAVPIDGDAKEIGLNPDARARLTQTIGNAAQCPEGAQIASKITAAYKAHFKDNGSRRVNTDAARIATEICTTESRMKAAREALESFECAASALASAEAEFAAARPAAVEAQRAADAAKPRFQEALERKSALKDAEDAVQAAGRNYEDLIAQSQRREAALRNRDALNPARDEATRSFQAAEAALAQAADARAAATNALDGASAPDAGLAELEAELTRATKYSARRRELGSLGELVARAETLAGRLKEIDAKHATVDNVAKSNVAVLSALVESERDFATHLDAATMSLALMAERALTIDWQTGDDGGNQVVPQGERFECSADGSLVLHIQGVASIELRGPVNDAPELRLQLSDCRRDLAGFEEAFGTRDPMELGRRLALREELERERARAVAELRNVLGTATLETLRATLATVRTELAAAPGDERLAELEAIVSERKTARDDCIAEFAQVMRAATAREAELASALTEGRRTLAAVEGKWRDVETELASLQRCGETEAERQATLNDAFTHRFETQRSRDAARTGFEPFRDVADPLAELKRLDELARQLALDAQKAELAVSDFKNKLVDGYAKAPSAELTELEEKLERLKAQLADEELTEAALKLLAASVAGAEARRIECFAQPVLERVAPWFREITGNALRGLELDADNVVSGLRLAGVEQTVDFGDLSMGMGDQLALLVRLALASLLTSPECLGPMPVLLDDPLVHADWVRRPRFLNVLEEVASGAQVVVFTCRPEDYQGLQARMVTIDPVEPHETEGAA